MGECYAICNGSACRLDTIFTAIMDPKWCQPNVNVLGVTGPKKCPFGDILATILDLNGVSAMGPPQSSKLQTLILINKKIK